MYVELYNSHKKKKITPCVFRDKITFCFIFDYYVFLFFFDGFLNLNFVLKREMKNTRF